MDATEKAAAVLCELAREWEKKLSYCWRTKGYLPLTPGVDYSREYAIERVIDELYTISAHTWDRYDRLNPMPYGP